MVAVVVAIAVWRANVRSALATEAAARATEADAEASRQAVSLTRLQMRQAQMPVVMPVAYVENGRAVKPQGWVQLGGRLRTVQPARAKYWRRRCVRHTSQPPVRRRCGQSVASRITARDQSPHLRCARSWSGRQAGRSLRTQFGIATSIAPVHAHLPGRVRRHLHQLRDLCRSRPESARHRLQPSRRAQPQPDQRRSRPTSAPSGPGHGTATPNEASWDLDRET